MAKDEGKNRGYHWRRSAGVYDAPAAKAKSDSGAGTDSAKGSQKAKATK